jgi:predicted permease
MNALLQDLKYGLRILVKSPGFMAVAVLTLALGIGANSTIFSWINSTLLDPLPGVRRSSELVSLTRGVRENPNPPFSYADYVDLRERNRSFSGLLGYHIGDSLALTGTGKPERLLGMLVSANYFDVLGVRPILGRGFLPAEELKPEGAPVVIISYDLWQTHFGQDASVIGRTIDINQHPFTIVGVTPAVFRGSMTGLRSDLWIPLVMDPVVSAGWRRLYMRETSWLNVYGRLRPGVARRQAQEEMNVLMQQIVKQYPDSHLGPNDITLDPLWRSPFGLNSVASTLLPMLQALAGALLLLACANVANLLLVRAVGRRRELAIRLSIGASRWRVVRQFLVESLLLALAGGGVAMLLTVWTAGTFAKFIPPTNIPISLDIRADRTVLLVTLVMSVFTGVIFGILPALRSSSIAPATVLKEEAGSVTGGLHKSILASGLVVAQISLSLLLLTCAGLLIRSFRAAQRFDAGFDPNHVLLASFDLLPFGYSRDAGIEFDRQLLAKIEALPGVESVTLANWLPLGMGHHTAAVEPEGYVPQPHEQMDIMRADVGPNYLRTLRIPLVAGRDFTPQDAAKSQPVAIVNQALADRYWPHQDALGKRIWTQGNSFTVVGVARNSNYQRLNETPQPIIYLPLLQDFYHDAVIHARVSGDPAAFALAVEKTVHELNADVPVFNVMPFKTVVELASTVERIAGTFVGAFGLLALVLAAVGIYGVVAYTTRQRSHEIGIRVALGAERGDVFRLVLGQGLQLTLSGLGVGLAVSLAVTRFLRAWLFGVAATDPLTYAGVAVLLCVVALAACFIPARRATKVEPTVALRCE